MNQIIVSYVLGKLTKVADVNPSDVKTSLFNGSIEIKKLSFRRELLSKLPIELNVEPIPLIYMKLPRPTSSDPVRVKVSGVHVKVALHELLRHGDRTKSWEALTPQALFNDDEFADLVDACSSSETDDEERSTPEEQTIGSDSMTSLPNSDVDDMDLASCESEMDDSVHSGATPPRRFGGALSYLKNRAKRSVEWIWERRAEVEIEDTHFEVVVDERLGISFSGTIQSIVVGVDPSQSVRHECVRHINVLVSDIFFTTALQQITEHLLRVSKVDINLSLVSDALGKLVRTNTAIEIDQVTVVLDECSMGAVARCVQPAINTLSIPRYCLPSLSLRSRKSWWPYTVSCVKAKLQDFKQRYNFSMSHIRFYGNARRRYLRFLDDCYRHRSMSAHQLADIEDLERDLRHPDVVEYLRHVVQEKYDTSALSSRGSTTSSGGGKPKQAPPPLPVESASGTKGAPEKLSTSLHFDLQLAKIRLPRRTAIHITGIHAEQRSNEVLGSIANIGFLKDSVPAYAMTSDEKALLALQVRTVGTSTETRFTVGDSAIHVELTEITRVVGPLLDIASKTRFLEDLLDLMPPPASEVQNVARAPTPLVKGCETVFLLIPSLSIALDDVSVNIQSCSIAIQRSQENDYPQYGVTLQEFNVQCGEEFLVYPLSISMTGDDRIQMGVVRIAITNRTFKTLKSMGKLAVSCVPEDVLITIFKPRSVCVPLTTLPASATTPVPQLLHSEIPQWSTPRRAQMIDVKGVSIDFELLSLSGKLQGIQVSPIRAVSGKGTKGWWRILVTNVQVSIDQKDLQRINVSVQPDQSIPEAPSGIEVCLLSDGLLSMSVRNVEISQQCVSAAAPFRLASIDAIRANIHRQNTVLTVDHVTALEGVSLKSVVFASHGEPLAFTDRPYLASTLQIICDIDSVDLRKFSGFLVDPLISFAQHIDSIASAELVPEVTYTTFYSGFSNMTFTVNASDCPLILSEESRLLFNLAHTVSSTPSIRTVEPLLPSFGGANEPIVLCADVEQLAIYLVINQVSVSLHLQSTEEPCALNLSLQDVNLRLPIAKLDKWNQRVQAIPDVPLRASVADCTLSLDVARVKSEGSFVDCTPVKFTVREVAFEKPNPPSNDSPTHDSDLQDAVGSRTSLDDSQAAETSDVRVQKLTLVADLSHQLEAYQRLFLLGEHFALIPHAFGISTVISSNLSHRKFVLEETGDLFFDNSKHNDVLIVESCSFSSCVTSRCLAVADGSVVLFRRCEFEHVSDCFIRSCGSNAFFFCDNCVHRRVSAKQSPSAPSTITKLHCAIDDGNFVVQLTKNTSLRGGRQLLEVSGLQKKSLSFLRLHLHGEQITLVDEGLSTAVCSKVSIEAEVSHKPIANALAANCSFGFGEVSIPVLPHVCSQVAAIAAIPLKLPPPRMYVVPPPLVDKKASFPLNQWKVLISFSVIPIKIILRNRCPLLDLNVSSGYVLTALDGHHGSKATLEGHIGISHLAILEFSSQVFRSITTSPMSIHVAGEAIDQHHVSVDAKISVGDLKCTTEQLRLLAITAAHCAEVTTTSVRVKNFTGEEVVLQRDAYDSPLRVKGDEVERLLPSVNAYQSVKTATHVAGTVVDHMEQAPALGAVYGMESAASFSTYNLVLADTNRYMLLKAVTHLCIQEIHVYTLFQIKNQSELTLRFSCLNGGMTSTVGPGCFSCIPTCMLSAKEVVLSVEWQGRTSESIQLWSQETASDFLDIVYSQEHAPQIIQKAFQFSQVPATLDGKARSVFLNFSFQLSVSGALVMFATPTWPEIRSSTLFPVEVEIVSSGEPIRSSLLHPGERTHFYDINPKFQYAFRLKMESQGTLFESSELCHLSTDTTSLSIVMQALTKGSKKQRSFELNVSSIRELGSNIVVWIIGTPQLCYVENWCDRDVSLLTTDRDTAEIKGPSEASSQVSSEYRGSYVAIKSPVRLKLGDGSVSEEFELTSGGEGILVECECSQKNCVGVACLTLFQPYPSMYLTALRMVPPLFIRNESPTGGIHLKHEIHHAGTDKCVFSASSFIPPLEKLPYFELAATGYTNYFSFAYDEDDLYSSMMESPLAPMTSWTGLLECGASTHRVTVVKKGPYDPAVISIGQPQPLRFQFINLTATEFEEGQSLSVHRCASPMFLQKRVSTNAPPATISGATTQEEMILTRKNGLKYRTTIVEQSVVEVEPELFLYTIVGSDETSTVVACGWNLNEGAISKRIAQSKVTVTGALSIPAVAVSIFHDKAIRMKASIKGISVWATISSGYSIQSTFSEVSLATRISGQYVYVISPFEINTSLRDAKVSPSTIQIKSFQSTITPIITVVSDYFLCQLYQIITHCGAGPRPTFAELLKSHTLLPQSDEHNSTYPKRIYLESAVLSPIPLEVSWDRSVRAPEEMENFLPWWTSLIPSLHHAALTTPQVEFQKISRGSVGALVANVQALYAKELLKQIPKVLGTVGFFKKNTSMMRHFASKIGGLFFGSSDTNSAQGSSSTLI